MTVSLVPLSAAAGLAGAVCAAGAVWAAPVAAGCAAGLAASAGFVSAGFGATVGAAVGLDGRQEASRVAAPPSAARVRNRRRVRAPTARSAAPPLVLED